MSTTELLPWQELAARVMDALADAQDRTNAAYPEHVKCYPSWERKPRHLRWLAEMFRTGRPIGSGAGQPDVLAALAATPADHIADAGKMVAAPAGWKLVPVQVPDSAFPWVSGGYSTDYRAHDPRDQKIIEDRAQRTWEAILDGIAATPAAAPDMVSVNKEDANNYCRILAELGMEEEGDPVTEVQNLLAASVAQDAVMQAVRNYYFALDTRQHGGVAASTALDAIQKALGLNWVQGAEASARAAAEGK